MHSFGGNGISVVLLTSLRLSLRTYVSRVSRFEFFAVLTAFLQILSPEIGWWPLGPPQVGAWIPLNAEGLNLKVAAPVHSGCYAPFIQY